MALLRILAIILALVCLLMLPSLAAALILGETFMIRAFLVPLVTGGVLALIVLLFTPKKRPSFRARDGFLLVFLTWVLASLAGSIPFYMSPLNISFYDSIFESACGYATTGATTIQDIEALPGSLLLWRSMNHWVGGMGIILLTVALMPLLGVGGFQLIKAETPGPEKEKLTPRITDAAKLMWGVYCAFTAILILLYRIGGMDWFDAVCHSFTIISTGGVSTKNAGFAFYDSAFIDWVTIIFMLLGALNFSMYYRLARGKFHEFLQNTECKVYLTIFIIAALVITFSLIPGYGSFAKALRFGSFQAASVLSSTGNARTDYTLWPPLAQGVLLCLMFIGGCSGSTAGGVKVIRYTVLFKQTGNELRRLLYPRGVFSIQLNKKVGRKDVVYGVAGFVFLYFMIVGVTTLVTTAAGFDIYSSLSAALCVTGNIGTGFGMVGPQYNYSAIPNYLKLFYSLVMITGRLELWTVLVLFTPEFWKRV
ncbi:MAG: TrkH family potassium uptake protein [Spirochaetaceae bacterium]|nr:TrkH family potassium uptake protein [Spirochaetaceae bacterium]